MTHTETSFRKVVRRFPPRKKTCVISVLSVCLGLAIHMYNFTHQTWTRAMNDSTDMWFLITLVFVVGGLVAGFVFGRAARLFWLVTVLTLLTFVLVGVYVRNFGERLKAPWEEPHAGREGNATLMLPFLRDDDPGRAVAMRGLRRVRRWLSRAVVRAHGGAHDPLVVLRSGDLELHLPVLTGALTSNPSSDCGSRN